MEVERKLEVCKSRTNCLEGKWDHLIGRYQLYSKDKELSMGAQVAQGGIGLYGIGLQVECLASRKVKIMDL